LRNTVDTIKSKKQLELMIIPTHFQNIEDGITAVTRQAVHNMVNILREPSG